MGSTLLNLAGRCTVVLCVLLGGCQFVLPPIEGNGVSSTERRAVSNFDQIDVSNAIQLELFVGEAVSVEVTADDNILPFIKTELIGSRLKVYSERSTSTKIGIIVKATTPKLNALEGTGATASKVTGVKTQSFDLKLSGASTCKLACEAQELSAILSGASQCALNGRVERLNIASSGASRLNAAELMAQIVDAELSGASTADVNASAELMVKASGASRLRYAGNPKAVENKISGASTVGPK